MLGLRKGEAEISSDVGATAADGGPTPGVGRTFGNITEVDEAAPGRSDDNPVTAPKATPGVRQSDHAGSDSVPAHAGQTVGI